MKEREWDGKLWPGSKFSDSWMAIHGLERSVCPLHSLQTGPNLKPDENWRRSCLICKLWKCQTPRHLSSTHLLGLQMRELGLPVCKYMLAWRGKGTGLLHSSLSSPSKKNLSLVDSSQSQHPPLLGRVDSAHFHQRKHLTAFCCFFLCVVVLSLEHWIKQEGILRQPEASFLLLKGAGALTSRYYLWVEATQTIQLKDTQAGRNHTSSLYDPWRKQFWEAAFKYSLTRVYFL